MGTVVSLLLSRKINTLSLGEEVCIGLGQNPVKIRLYTLLLIIPMCAVSVAVAGKYRVYWAYRPVYRSKSCRK